MAQRRGWPLPDIVSELAGGYLEAGPVIGAADGRPDVIALGVWLHGSDVRDALGEPLAHESAGFADACILLGDWTRRRAVPLVDVTMPGVNLSLGAPVPGRPPAALRAGPATMMRLFAGRPGDPADYQLAGAVPGDLVVF